MKNLRLKYPTPVLEGTHAIPYRIMFMVAPILTLTVPLAEWLSASNTSVLDWAIAGVVGSFCTYIACVLTDNTFFKNRIKKPVSNLKNLFWVFALALLSDL